MECRSEQSGSLILTLWMTRLYSRRQPFRWALNSLSEEAEPIRLRVSWIKIKVQAFGNILDATVESIHLSGENSRSRIRSHGDVYLPGQRDSLVYQMRTRCQSTTGTSLGAAVNSLDECAADTCPKKRKPEFLLRWSCRSHCILLRPKL